MVRFFIFAAVVSVALMIYTLIECSRAPKHLVRSLPKSAWFAVIIVLPLVGAVLWFILGRPVSTANQSSAQQTAPDDDEDFLRQLEVWRRQQQREAESKAREQELNSQSKNKKNDDSVTKPESNRAPGAEKPSDKSEDTDSDSPDTKA
ncbi:PLD nuclease N-terminal domain-containing protein [Arthrobacter sp. NIO-1057]|uniref:PLD nuclease N-terminal domain-containing protein n=1 Tax=Arthrobacter sp. NIO-1057 TaxID=993071 RepID=UPI000818174C|nr:PLD nuclease N-terminal domain-containing protein [Arthrobacter sp. NIO-1057]SCC04384.1 Phospholipase_D-nuclease N-terminal [Arthrobacter sp. NIO-1057]